MKVIFKQSVQLKYMHMLSYVRFPEQTHKFPTCSSKSQEIESVCIRLTTTILLLAYHVSFAIATPQPAVTPEGAHVGGTTVEDMQDDNSQHCESVGSLSLSLLSCML